jgi:DNA polymerase-1
VLVDGHALIYRAFFALPSLTNRKGELVNAAFGFVSMLLNALQTRPDYVIAAFDLPGATFRHQELAGYKIHRRPMPDELRPQIPIVRDIISAFPIPIYEVEGYEADDVIGTLARQAEQQGLHTTILTGDLDALQLVTPHVDVLTSRRGVSETILYDEARVRERYGFDPPRVADLKALAGDVSDNIPGVPGIGEKTALKLIQEYGPLEAILAHVDRMPAGKVRRLLEAHAEQALLSKRMATIVCDLPIAIDLRAGATKSFQAEPVRRLLEEMGFPSLAARVPAALNGGGAAPGTGAQAAFAFTPVAPAEPFTGTTVVRDERALRALTGRLKSGSRCILQTVLTQEPARHGRIAGFAIGFPRPDGSAETVAYVPTEHAQESTLPLAAVLRALTPALQDATVRKIGYNLKNDYLALRAHGVPLQGLEFDILIAAYLLNSGIRMPSLKGLAHDVLQVTLEAPEALLGQGKSAVSPAGVALEQAADFYGRQVAAMCALQPALTTQLDGVGLRPLFHEVEMPLSTILADMELAGVTIDTNYLKLISRELYQAIQKLEVEITDSAHGPFNINSPIQLGKFLYEDLKLEGGRKTKTGYSTDAAVLETFRDQHPVIDKILDYRHLTKLKSTYVDALPLLVDPKTNRLHTSFNQTVAATGRLSSSDPNLQNIPIRTDVGQRIRRAFAPARAGDVMLAADYSQIELRVLAHLSRDALLLEAFAQGQDIHGRTAAEVFAVPLDRVTRDQRRLAKVVNFGIVYGLSEYGLARDIGMPTAEARAFIEAYFRKYYGVREFLEGIKAQAREQGYVETLLRRRRYIQDIKAPNRALRQAAERVAINMPVQGSAADIMKLGMIQLAGEMARRRLRSTMVLQVHDELVFEVPPEEVDTMVEVVPKLLAGAYQLVVPLQVDVKVGPNWYDMNLVRHAGTP